MASLRAFIRTARMIRNASHLAVGLPADDEVLDAPDERLAPVLVAADRGEYAPAAKLLTTTREAAEWENRDRYVSRLGAFARSRGGWLDQWQQASPHDPDALLVKAELALTRGWASPARGELLRDMGPLISAAAEAEPRDPVPWRIALDHARGTTWATPGSSGCGPRRSDAPRTTTAVMARPSSICRRPGTARTGSASTSPSRTRRTRSPTRWYGHCRYGRPSRTSPRTARPWPAEVRNLLTYVLVRLERRQDALQQLRMIGPYATSFPWDLESDDPLRQFLELRDGVRLEVASGIPLRSRSAAVRRPRSEHTDPTRPDDH